MTELIGNKFYTYMSTINAFNIVKFQGVRQLSLNFLGCPDIHVTHCCCANMHAAQYFQLTG
jgi:hypothetical protein